MNKNYGKTALKILDCATDIFAEKGFEGTIMDDLAEHCIAASIRRVSIITLMIRPACMKCV